MGHSLKTVSVARGWRQPKPGSCVFATTATLAAHRTSSTRCPLAFYAAGRFVSFNCGLVKTRRKKKKKRESDKQHDLMIEVKRREREREMKTREKERERHTQQSEASFLDGSQNFVSMGNFSNLPPFGMRTQNLTKCAERNKTIGNFFTCQCKLSSIVIGIICICIQIGSLCPIDKRFFCLLVCLFVCSFVCLIIDWKWFAESKWTRLSS